MLRRTLPGLLLALLLVSSAGAMSIGVNRANIAFTDVLRGGYAQTEVVVTTDSIEPIAAEVIIYDAEAAPWVNVSLTNFTFSRDAPYTLYVDVQPPQDAQIKEYRVNMSILTGELGRGGGGLIGTATRASLGVPILIQMTGTERLSCQIGGLKVPDGERGQPLQVELSVINTGNVRVNPDITMTVHDKFRSEVLGTSAQGFGSAVLPTTWKQGRLFYALDLPRDQYWLTVEVPQCGYSDMRTFDMLDAGEVKDDGEFIRIDMQSWADVGDIVPIKAVFRNNGVRAVRANFRGTITRIDTGEIAKVINTDQYLIDPSATAEIETFFNPVLQGRYMVNGKVFYNEKLTPERNSVLNVNPGSGGGSIKASTMVLGGLVLVIIILLLLIIRRRARNQR